MTKTKKTKREQAFDLYKEYAGNIELTKIASLVGSPASTVRGWKSKDKWDDKLAGTLRNKKRNASKKKPKRSNKPGAPKGNKNGEGNQGGAPPRNNHAVSHGLFAKHLPPETLEIFTGVAQFEPADMLWQNIMIQYTAILRAQKIMYVGDHYDKTEETVGMSKSVEGQSMTKTFQQAWDKHEQFLMAQSRAMATLNTMIKQFVTMTNDSDERHVKLATMNAILRKTEAETKIIEEKAKDHLNSDNPIIFVESVEEMVTYMEAHADEYADTDK